MFSRRSNKSIYFLLTTTFFAAFLLPFAILKRSFKDWIIVFLVSIIGNFFADRLLILKGYLHYPIRPFAKKFQIHLPFDFFQYPLMLLYYNQWTLNSGPVGMILKLFPFVIPQVIIETIAAKKSHLIQWKKGWSWYHSFLAMVVKLLICRSIIAGIRIINTEKISTT